MKRLSNSADLPPPAKAGYAKAGAAMLLARRRITICLVATMILAIGSMANADWNPGEPYKMHYPQLPDPLGWDVAFDDFAYTYGQKPLADDWLCTGTGPVTDIHLWVSWQGDMVGYITALNVAIYSDIPKEDPEDPHSFSKPGRQLWQRLLYPDMIKYGEGDQGWLDPFRTSVVTPHDHKDIYQLNITDIASPFEQIEGNIYWLVINGWWTKGDTEPFMWPGWKTSEDHWNDDAVYATYYIGGEDPWLWQELTDPITGYSLDLAFVITPEPATICLLGLGALSLIRRKK